MFELPVWQFSTNVRSGAGQWLAEAIATFGLLLTIFGLARAPAAIPYAVGLYITSAYWFTASTSFANPAVTLARSATNTFAGIRPVGCQLGCHCQAHSAFPTRSAASSASSGTTWL